jgi:dTDP-4-amino-4,6-dideoxygalactose transaminase
MGNDFGINSRMDEIQATVLLKKLEGFSKMIERRQQMLLKYKHQLEEKGVWVLNWQNENVPHLFPILVNISIVSISCFNLSFFIYQFTPILFCILNYYLFYFGI